MKNEITIGLPSKGRLKDKAMSFFEENGFKILQSDKERNYFATIENKPNLKIIYLHAKEIIQRMGDGTLDLGISGLDLLNESEKNLRDKIIIKNKLNFGKANLVVAVPDDWIDVQTIADLEEVSFDIRSKRNTRLRVATKYPNLTNDFLLSKGVTRRSRRSASFLGKIVLSAFFYFVYNISVLFIISIFLVEQGNFLC